MKLTLRQQLTQFGHLLQDRLFPILEESCGEMDQTMKRLVAVIELVPLGRFVPAGGGWVGRPARDREAIGRAFIAKAVLGIALTRQLIQRLRNDESLRKICGWTKASQVPSESKFSRVFAEFAEMQLPQFVHEALIQETQKDRLIGHISRDSTAIEARERIAEERAEVVSKSKEKADKERAVSRELKTGGVFAAVQEMTKKKRGSRGPHKPYKGGKYKAEKDTRLHRQRSMKLEKMLEELPKDCSVGAKTDHEGREKCWNGYKLHLDVADGQIPISAIVTGASLHDSQVAIPLATMTGQRVVNLYDLMDAAYDAGEIIDHSLELGHVPLITPVRRKVNEQTGEREATRSFTPAEELRFNERTTVERVNARLKDEFGVRDFRVRGHKKVAAHLMFAVLALTARVGNSLSKIRLQDPISERLFRVSGRILQVVPRFLKKFHPRNFLALHDFRIDPRVRGYRFA